ncbi:MAG: electron transfer flavoprotein subunit alpha/FixB family protein [Bacteroidetes bacterium]|nr:electron transfer flavoprotein subunit alpha/FixB family protein [Bacteroidota bacterium]
MNILILPEIQEGAIRRTSFELISYAVKLSSLNSGKVFGLAFGHSEEALLQEAAAFGLEELWHVNSIEASTDPKSAVKTTLKLAEEINASLILTTGSPEGKTIAAGVAARLNACYASGVTGLPVSINPFVVHRKFYSGKALETIDISSSIKVLSLAQNSFEIIENPKTLTIHSYSSTTVSENAFTILKKEHQKEALSLNEASIVVAGGRGMKGPENWPPLEELANLLGAATACSRPVSDEGWRPHHEHVGQTGKVIAPNLYIAIGISGAIQHLAGVSSSRMIIAINRDPEAPIFQSADYGIVGDAHEILPIIIEAVRRYRKN